MSGKIQHDPEAFVLALASAHDGYKRNPRSITPTEAERWRRVAQCAMEHLARDAAASAAVGASETAQAAMGRVIERICDLLRRRYLERADGITRSMSRFLVGCLCPRVVVHTGEKESE